MHRNVLLLVLWLFLTVSGSWGQQVGEEEQDRHAFVNKVMSKQKFVKHPGREYESYAFRDYRNYDNYFFPYTTSERNYFGPLGHFLINGYGLYNWSERRGPTPEGSSNVGYAQGRFENIFNRVVVMSDQYNSWAAKLIMAEELRVAFTPLTLDQVDARATRIDMQTPNNVFTAYLSRYGPDSRTNSMTTGDIRQSALVFGGHYERKIGLVNLGATYVNASVFDVMREDNDLFKGVYRPDQVTPSMIVVRVSDESPRDGRGGPTVFDMNIYVNGEQREDLVPFVVKKDKRERRTTVGRSNPMTGEFTPSGYTSFMGYAWSGDLYKFMDTPYYGDAFYLRDYMSGDEKVQNNVAKSTDLKRLLERYHAMPTDVPIATDGHDVLLYYFDLSDEEYVKSVEFDAVVANDYKIEISEIDQVKGRVSKYDADYNATYFRPVAYSKGNVQDGSNMRRIGFKAGVPTALSTRGLNLNTNILGLKINGEYAFVKRYLIYPDGPPGQLDPRMVAGVREIKGMRFHRQADAYYVNVLKENLGRFGFGGEYFSISPDYDTRLRMHIPGSAASGALEFYIHNRTGIIDLVHDNDDDDRWNDMSQRRLSQGGGGKDLDGVFPGNDQDRDGNPDTNRNNNYLPDYAEPFLRYHVESDDYYYDLDLNNNDVPDDREDDLEPDYPYPRDLRGGHLFGSVHLTRNLRVMAGRLDAEGISGGGNNQLSYIRLNYSKDDPGFGRVVVENNLKRVKDDIPDELYRYDEGLRGGSKYEPRGYSAFYGDYHLQYQDTWVEDQLLYRNSWVNRFYFGMAFTKIRGLNLVNKTKVEINKQIGERLDNGMVQREDRIVSIALVNKADYTYRIGEKWELEAQLKLQFLKQKQRTSPFPLHHERILLPILKVGYWLTPRTVIRGAMEGIPGQDFSHTDLADDRESYEQRTYTIFFTNRSRYFGYNLATSAGLVFERWDYIDPFRVSEEYDSSKVFFQVILGY